MPSWYYDPVPPDPAQAHLSARPLNASMSEVVYWRTELWFRCTQCWNIQRLSERAQYTAISGIYVRYIPYFYCFLAPLRL